MKRETEDNIMMNIIVGGFFLWCLLVLWTASGCGEANVQVITTQEQENVCGQCKEEYDNCPFCFELHHDMSLETCLETYDCWPK